MNFDSVTPRPIRTSGVMQRKSLTGGLRSASDPAMASARTLAGDDRGRGRQQDLDVGPQRPSPRVPQIQAHHVVEGGAAAAGNLPESGDSGLGFEQPTTMPRLVLLDLVGQRRSGPDQPHLAATNVPELWQLVQAGLAKDPTDWRDPRIVR